MQYSPDISPYPIDTSLEIREYPFPQTSNQSDGARENAGDGSPRSAVAGALQDLNLQGGFIRRLDYMDAGRPRKKVAVTSDEDELLDGQAPASRTEVVAEQNHARDLSATDRPTTPSKATKVDAAFSPSQKPQESTTIVSTPRKSRSRSPPLHTSVEENPLTWHDSEITGHNPTDPDDDGYGINGIGFRPTGAIAWARSQKRNQQVADYRSREAREARQRRSERRRYGTASRPVSPAESPRADRKKGKVRFESDLAGTADKEA